MHLLHLTAQNKHKECNTIPHTDKINTISCSLLSKLDTQISRKLSLTHLHSYMSSNYKKVYSLTYYSPMVRKVTIISKDTSIKISFRTNNTIRNKLNIRTHFTKPYTPSGIYQLEYQTSDRTCIGQTCCRLKQRYKEHIRYITSNEPQYKYPPLPTFSTISMNMDP
jgi:hypothetical protein